MFFRAALCPLSTTLFLCAVAGSTASQDLTPPAALGTSQSLAGVLIDAPGDGAVWVLAPGYKARFAPDGVTYYPYFGARAPRLFPVHFALARAARGATALPVTTSAEPRIVGQEIWFERGALREVWSLRRQEVEQSFVLLDSAGSGDLTLGLSVRSDLSAEDVADGLRFVHPALGHVHYGDVRAWDQGGARAATAARLVAGGIELSLPHAFLAGARGTVTLDPIVRTFTVDGGADQVAAADVAFEPTQRRWLVVYVREFATTDTDVIARRFNEAGDLLEEVAVATGTRESRNPSVGANGPAQQFLIAWDEDTSVADRVIVGRTRDASSTSQSSVRTLLDSSGLGIDDISPQVGGSVATDSAGANYAVVCLSDRGGNSREVSLVRVTTNGTPTYVTALSGGGVTDVRISKARRTAQPWACLFLTQAGTAQHLSFVPAPATGSVASAISVDSDGDCRLGGIAGAGPQFLGVYTKVVAAGNADVFGIDVRIGNPTFIIRFNLTTLEPGAVAAVHQSEPTVAFDGARYTYAYRDAVGTGADLFAATLSLPRPGSGPGPVALFTSGHQQLHAATATDVELEPQIACSGDMGGLVGRSLITFTRVDTTGDADVEGLLYDGIATIGGVTQLATGCAGFTIGATTAPILGGVLDVTASTIGGSSQVFLLGLPTPPIQLCAAGCALGVLPILNVFSGVSVNLPIPGSPDLLGATLALQNVALLATAGCTARDTGVPLITSPTLVITFR